LTDQAGLHTRRCEEREKGIDGVLDGHLVSEGWNESKRICNIPMGSDEAGYGEVAWELLWYARQSCINFRKDRQVKSILTSLTSVVHVALGIMEPQVVMLMAAMKS
jgi:hypothetical protein